MIKNTSYRAVMHKTRSGGSGITLKDQRSYAANAYRQITSSRRKAGVQKECGSGLPKGELGKLSSTKPRIEGVSGRLAFQQVRERAA